MVEKEIIMSVKNVSKKFGGLCAVNDVSFDVKQGEILGLIGANGAGKTTLFNMMSGMFKVTSGTICYQNHNITNKPCNRICKLGVARTFQIVKPFTNMTAFENVMVGALLHTSDIKKARARVEELIVMVGLKDRMNVAGEYLNLPELKKLELAKCLSTNPELLLLDEVMAGMGPTQTDEIVELIKKINCSGRTIVVIEHVMRALMSLSDRICVLDQGNLIASGKPQEIAHDPLVIKSYLGERKTC